MGILIAYDLWKCIKRDPNGYKSNSNYIRRVLEYNFCSDRHMQTLFIVQQVYFNILRGNNHNNNNETHMHTQYA